MSVSAIPPRGYLGKLQVMRADLVTPSHEKKGGHDGSDIDGLHDRQHSLPAEYAVDQKQRTGDEPDQPGQTTDPPRASLDEEVMYLRVVCDDDQRRPYPA